MIGFQVSVAYHFIKWNAGLNKTHQHCVTVTTARITKYQIVVFFSQLSGSSKVKFFYCLCWLCRPIITVIHFIVKVPGHGLAMLIRKFQGLYFAKGFILTYCIVSKVRFIVIEHLSLV